MSDLGPIVLATTAHIPGGTWRHMRDLGEGLRDQGLDVSFALDDGAESLRAEAVAAGHAVLRLADPSVLQGAILHVHLADTFDRRAARLIRSHRGGPVVVTEHLPRTNASDRSLLPADRRTPGAALAKSLFKRRELTAVDVVIAVSESSAAFIRQAWGVDDRKLAVVPNGVSSRAYEQLDFPATQDLHVVTIGTLSVQKGHDLLIAALRHTTSRWRATLVGEGHQRPEYEAQAAAPPAVDVAFAGWQPDPAAIVATASLVCVPSRWESFCYVAVEAGLWGRAVVASDVDGPDEIVLDGTTGILVPPDDPRAIARALDVLAADPARLREMGARARDRAVATYGVERMIAGTITAYTRAFAPDS